MTRRTFSLALIPLALSLFIPFILNAATCVDLSRTLSLNAKGTDVTKLQQFLRDNAGYTGQVTGNFGPLTRAAVGTWQIQKGIVDNSSTAGYGQVGPKTRAAMRCIPMFDLVGRTPDASSIESLKAEVVRLVGVLNSLLAARGLPPVSLPTFATTAITRTSGGGGGGGTGASPSPAPSPSSDATHATKIASAIEQIKLLQNASDKYVADTKYLPPTCDLSCTSTTDPFLNARGIVRWKGPYLSAGVWNLTHQWDGHFGIEVGDVTGDGKVDFYIFLDEDAPGTHTNNNAGVIPESALIAIDKALDDGDLATGNVRGNGRGFSTAVGELVILRPYPGVARESPATKYGLHIYDTMFYKDQPDLSPWGVEKAAMLYEAEAMEIYDSGSAANLEYYALDATAKKRWMYLRLPDETYFKNYVRQKYAESTSGVIVVDWEGSWGMYANPDGTCSDDASCATETKKRIAYHNTILRWVRDAAPDARVGFYDTGTVWYNSAHEGSQSANYLVNINNITAAAELMRSADFVVPNLYINLGPDDEGPYAPYTIHGLEKQLTTAIAEIRKVTQKPIYPILTPLYNDEVSKKHGGQEIPAELWAGLLRVIEQTGAEGIILWGGWNGGVMLWDPNAAWWRETQKFRGTFGIVAGASTGACVDISRTLSLNAKGTDVSALQEFLRDNAGYAGAITGNFGPLTRAAVGTWQIQKGIVANSSTAGYGQVGPKTRAAMRCSAVPSTTSPSTGSGQSLEALKAEVVRLVGVLNSLLTARGLPLVHVPTFAPAPKLAQVPRAQVGGGSAAPTISVSAPPPAPSPRLAPPPAPSILPPAPSPSQIPDLKITYGAVGDGITDDTDAWQRAVADASVSTLYVPPGTYRLRDTATLASSKTIYGVGASSRLLYVQNGGTPRSLLVFERGSSTSTLKDIYIDYDVPGSPRGGDSLGPNIIFASQRERGAISDITVEGIEIYAHDAQVNGITLDSVDGARVRGNYIHDIYGQGIMVSGADFVVVSKNRVERYHRDWAGIWCIGEARDVVIDSNIVDGSNQYLHNTGAGISCRGVGGQRLSNISITNNTYVGVPNNNTYSAAIILFEADNSRVIGNHTSGGGEGLAIASNTNTIVSGNMIEKAGVNGFDGCNPGDTITNNVFSGEGYTQIGIVSHYCGPGHTVIADNKIIGILSYGIARAHGGGLGSYEVYGNEIRFDPSATNGSAGIYVRDAGKISIRNNVIDGTNQNARHGINWIDSSDGVIEANTIRNFFLTGILVEASYTTIENLIVKNNTYSNNRTGNLESIGIYGEGVIFL